jgi:hypothetical protein
MLRSGRKIIHILIEFVDANELLFPLERRISGTKS